MQNLILLAVICVGFFYALYRVYKRLGWDRRRFRLRRQLYELPDGRRLRFPEGRKLNSVKRTAQPIRTVLSFFLQTRLFFRANPW